MRVSEKFRYPSEEVTEGWRVMKVTTVSWTLSETLQSDKERERDGRDGLLSRGVSK